MSQELVLKDQTKVAASNDKQDILSLYGVPTMLNRIVRKEKKDFLSHLCCDGVLLDSLNHLAHSEDLMVEIPSGLRELLRAGKASFDKSGKIPGAYTPNIRINGKLQGQAIIEIKTNPMVVTETMSNLAMMAMVQSVLEKLDVIESGVEEIKNGQSNNRIGTIIGAFKGFMDLYPNFLSTEEMRNTANKTYIDMQEGLAQYHLQIEIERKRLEGAPINGWDALAKSIRHPSYNVAERYQKYYEKYVYDLQLYNRLILLSDIILHFKGDKDSIRNNHKVMMNYCRIYLDESFKKNMDFLTEHNIQGIKSVEDYNSSLENVLEKMPYQTILLECKKEDVKYLTQVKHES